MKPATQMESVLRTRIKEAVKELYNSEVSDDLIQIQETRKDFIRRLYSGCFSIVAVFQKHSGKNRRNYRKTADWIHSLPSRGIMSSRDF